MIPVAASKVTPKNYLTQINQPNQQKKKKVKIIIIVKNTIKSKYFINIHKKRLRIMKIV